LGRRAELVPTRVRRPRLNEDGWCPSSSHMRAARSWGSYENYTNAQFDAARAQQADGFVKNNTNHADCAYISGSSPLPPSLGISVACAARRQFDSQQLARAAHVCDRRAAALLAQRTTRCACLQVRLCMHTYTPCESAPCIACMPSDPSPLLPVVLPPLLTRSGTRRL
jgi:hypothetical protein